jgi:Tfp pilus assembly protein PilV
MKKNSRILLILVCMTAVLSLSGCSEKETDEASTRVMQLTITPRPTATPRPKESFPEATATNEDLTMINQYLVDRGSRR